MSDRTTITISRQLGCGGSYIGQLIATNLGIKYVDREVLHRAAQELGLEETVLAAHDQKLTPFWEKILRGLTFGPPEAPYTPPPVRTVSDKELFKKETEIMKEIAANVDCVIIGRACGLVIPKHPGLLSIFFHAPIGFRVKRTMQVYNIQSKQQALSLIEETDTMRTKYVAEMTGKEWGCAPNYNLCVDTSLMPFTEIAEMLVEIIKRRKEPTASQE